MNRNAIDFSERMAQGRDLAQVARNRGQSTGKRAGCSWPKRQANHYGEPGSWEALCWQERNWFRWQCAAIRNDFAAACLNYDSEPQNRLKSAYDLTDTF